MSAGTFVEVLQVLAALAALVWFFSGPWPSCCAAASRQRLLELRDRLLRLASREGVGSDDPVVRRTLEWLDAGVGVAHRMTFWNVVAVAAIARNDPDGPPDPYAAIRDMENGSLKDGLREIVRLSLRAHIAHMISRSPVDFMALLATGLVWRGFGTFRDRTVALSRALAQGDAAVRPPGAAARAG